MMFSRLNGTLKRSDSWCTELEIHSACTMCLNSRRRSYFRVTYHLVVSFTSCCLNISRDHELVMVHVARTTFACVADLQETSHTYCYFGSINLPIWQHVHVHVWTMLDLDPCSSLHSTSCSCTVCVVSCLLWSLGLGHWTHTEVHNCNFLLSSLQCCELPIM
jgi:hypothetical protein